MITMGAIEVGHIVTTPKSNKHVKSNLALCVNLLTKLAVFFFGLGD